MMIRHLIVPLTAAVVSLHAGHVLAQGAFPAPLPNQSAALWIGAPVTPLTGGNGEAFAGAALWLGNGAGNAPCARTFPA